MSLVMSIKAAVAYLRDHSIEMTPDEVDHFKDLAEGIYILASPAQLVSNLPQVPELRPELESQDPPLPPVQFITKLNLPGDWDLPADDGAPIQHSYRLLSMDEPPAPAARNFLPCASPRWFHDMDVLLRLAEANEAEEKKPSAQKIPTAVGADVSHSADFRSVRWFGTEYVFTPTQAACVRVLWGAWEEGSSVVSQTTILDKADSRGARLRDVFEKGKHPAWKTMIVDGGRKGAYRLADPATPAK